MCSELPAWKRLISYPLSTGERTSLLISIFDDRNEAEAVGHLFGGDAQTFVNVIDEVRIHTLLPRRTGGLTPTNIIASYRLGIGYHPTRDPQEVFAFFIQDLCPPSLASKISRNPALLQSNGDPTMSWWVWGRVEGPA